MFDDISMSPSVLRRAQEKAAKLARSLDLLAEAPRTAKALAIAIGVSEITVRRYLLKLHLTRAIHVDDWVEAGKHQSPVYAVGDTPDKARPSHKRHTAPRKATPKRAEPAPARRPNAQLVRDPLIAALFGPAHN